MTKIDNIKQMITMTCDVKFNNCKRLITLTLMYIKQLSLYNALIVWLHFCSVAPGGRYFSLEFFLNRPRKAIGNVKSDSKTCKYFLFKSAKWYLSMSRKVTLKEQARGLNPRLCDHYRSTGKLLWLLCSSFWIHTSK